jgi:serine/threonine protein phosphatase PrpC
VRHPRYAPSAVNRLGDTLNPTLSARSSSPELSKLARTALTDILTQLFRALVALIATAKDCPLVLTLEAAASTHTGLVRANNQDAFGMDRALGLYIVCDGMGGAAGGEIASKLAVDTFLAIARQELHSCADTNLVLGRAVAAANRAVVERARWDTRYRGMGTTLVAGRLCEDNLTLINVGDSRAYLFREGQPSQLTSDHSWVAERVYAGLMTHAEAETSSLQSVITRAIGAEPDVHPDIVHLALKTGDTVLLCSDGLTRHVHPDELAATLAATSNQTPEAACEQLVALANQRGGQDNITCIVLRLTA